MKRIVLSMGLLVGALGCNNGAAVMPPPEAAPAPITNGWAGEPPAVEVFPESEPGEKLRVVDSAAMVRTRWQGTLPGDHQRVELVAPNGRVYETLQGPLNARGEAEVRLLLAGSFIEEFKLYGTWKARVFYNNAEAPVREISFEVEP